MAAFDQLRDRWETMAPRERRLVGILGVTFVVCVFGFVGLQIRSGLVDLRAKNEATRAALQLVEEHLAAPPAVASNEPIIPDTAPSLGSYLEQLATEVGISIPETTDRGAVEKGKFRELSTDIKLRGVTLDQLARFLKLVETRQSAVATQRLYIKPFVSARDKLDVEITVSTWEKAKKPAKKKGEAAADQAKSGG